MPLDHLIYVSSGNIPSIAANAMAQVKQATAFAQLLSRVELLIPATWRDVLGLRRFDFITFYGLSTPPPITQLPIYPWLHYPLRSGYGIRRFFNRAAAIYTRWRRPQIAYTRSLPAARLLTSYRVPTVFECHDPAPLGFRTTFEEHPLFRHYLAGVVTTLPKLTGSYVDVGISAERVLAAYGAVDVQQYAAAPDRDTARQQLGLPLDAPLAVYAGHLYPHRGIEDIFTLARRNPGVNFLLVGGWPVDVEQREAECAALGLQNVQLAGFKPQQDLPRYIAAADVCLMPFSRHLPNANWAIPTKMYEYMAAGRPIIATDLPFVQGFLQHEKNALLVEPDNPDALDVACKRLLSDNNLAVNLAAQARQDVQPYSWEKRARRIIAWLHDLSV
jgi:glycosyltransferase involved in cell wall biosynthesis